MHLDEEKLQRLLHGELGGGRASSEVREHLATCAECRHRLTAAERDEAEILGLLRHLDHPTPAVNAEALAARARGRGPAWRRWAAGIVLLMGAAGAAYAVPGSPVREWVRSAAAWIGDGKPSKPATGQSETPPRMAGIAAAPGRDFVIQFESFEPGGRAEVSLNDGREVTVRAPIGTARFTSAARRLTIQNLGSGATFEIEVPRAAPRVEIRVGDRPVFLKEGERLVTQGSLGADGKYRIRLTAIPH